MVIGYKACGAHVLSCKQLAFRVTGASIAAVVSGLGLHMFGQVARGCSLLLSFYMAAMETTYSKEAVHRVPESVIV